MFKSQISAILKLDSYSRKYFKGVYAIDQLEAAATTTTTKFNHSSNNKSAFVINYDESSQEGSHWVAVFRDTTSTAGGGTPVVEFFDSSGLPPMDERIVEHLLLVDDEDDGRGGGGRGHAHHGHGIRTNYTFNPNKLQQLSSNACGFYAVYFILKRSRGCTSDEILKILTRTNSDYYVKNYLYSIYKPIFA